MKRLIALFLTLTLILALAACGSGSSDSGFKTTMTTDEYGNNVIEFEGCRTAMIDTLPYDLVYNNSHISLIDISFYENVADYSHNLFIVTTLDVSELSEEQLHWLRESDLDVNAYLTSENNGYDSTPASFLGSLYYTDTEKLIFVHTSSFGRENRYSFSGAELSLTVTVTQEETYEHKFDDGSTSNFNKEEKLHYSGIVDENLPDAETIEEPLYSYVVKWLRNEADFYGGLS